MDKRMTTAEKLATLDEKMRHYGVDLKKLGKTLYRCSPSGNEDRYFPPRNIMEVHGDVFLDLHRAANLFFDLFPEIREAIATYEAEKTSTPDDVRKAVKIPDAQTVYGEHNGKKLTKHPEGVEQAIETFLRYEGAVFVDGQPVEKFGIATAAMSSAIQAYLDYYRKGVGETNETGVK